MFNSRRPSILSSKDGSVNRFNCSSAEAMFEPVSLIAKYMSTYAQRPGKYVLLSTFRSKKQREAIGA